VKPIDLKSRWHLFGLKTVNVKLRLPVCLKPMLTGNMLATMQSKLGLAGLFDAHWRYWAPIIRAVEFDENN